MNELVLGIVLLLQLGAVVPDCEESGPVIELVVSVGAAATIAEDPVPEREKRTWLQSVGESLFGSDRQYTPLEQEVLAAVAESNAYRHDCEPRLLGATQSSEAGFALGREKAYREALDIFYAYQFTFEDERERGRCSADDDGGKWSAAEIAQIHALVKGLGPWAQDLGPLPIVREDEPAKGSNHVATAPLYEDGTMEVRVTDEALRVGNACFLMTFTHELVHIFFFQHPELGLALARRLGWQTEEEYRTKLYGDQSWRLHAWQWTLGLMTDDELTRAPDRYVEHFDDPDHKYHMTNYKEDLAERVTVYALGPAIGALAASNQMKPGTHPVVATLNKDGCADRMTKDMPDLDEELFRYLSSAVPSTMAHVHAPTVAGLQLGVTTREEVKVRHPDMDLVYVWRPEASEGSQLFAVLNHGVVVGVGSALDEHATRDSLIEELGQPTMETSQRLVWMDELVTVNLDGDGNPSTIVYGYVSD